LSQSSGSGSARNEFPHRLPLILTTAQELVNTAQVTVLPERILFLAPYPQMKVATKLARAGGGFHESWTTTPASRLNSLYDAIPASIKLPAFRPSFSYGLIFLNFDVSLRQIVVTLSTAQLTQYAATSYRVSLTSTVFFPT
jgi:hypothetical protein